MASTNEPVLSINSPTLAATHCTGLANLCLSGSVASLGQLINSVTWTNFANSAKGIALGTNTWGATDIPLVVNNTNLIIVVGTTTSWAPAYGGNTTFNDTLAVIQSPLRVTLSMQGTHAVLNWIGGGSPFRVQRATDLALGDWVDFLSDVVTPISLPTEGHAGFYRVVGQ